MQSSPTHNIFQQLIDQYVPQTFSPLLGTQNLSDFNPLNQDPYCSCNVQAKDTKKKMESTAPSHSKNQRRKRKDHESRDFVCKCGKKYLSYPAAYTHVKSKHNGAKQFLQNIVQPDKVKLKRGRPKQRKVYEMSPENLKLTIIQESILSIFEFLVQQDEETELSGIVIEGNKQFSHLEFAQHYQQLIKMHGITKCQIYTIEKGEQQLNAQLFRFTKQMIQHFQPQLAAKIVYFLNTLLENGSNMQSMDQSLALQVYFDEIRSSLKIKDIGNSLWEQSQIPEIIIHTLERWISVDQGDRQSSDNYISF